MIAVMMAFMTSGVRAAPFAAIVVDARSGEVLHAQNADTRLHPASLTKMMTLYIVFEAIEHGEIGLDDYVTVSKKAAAEPPSKLGLRPGQKIKLRHLIRGAAVKSANDAATALAEAVGGSEAAFARRMNRTAKALGMTRTTFRNAHGLTEEGHLSTARDMTTLGRHLFYDYPQYYNLFSRQTADAGGRTVSNTNRRFLASYRGADGIKTGYTRAAGFNLVASAERGSERIIATVFGGTSTAVRNAKVAELLDFGFRKAPTRVAVRKPQRPVYVAEASTGTAIPGTAAKTIRVSMQIKASPRPARRPGAEPAVQPPAALLAAVTESVENALEAAQVELAASASAATTPQPPQPPAAAMPTVTPRPRPEHMQVAAVANAAPAPKPAVRSAPAETGQEIVTRLSSSGGRYWGINVGRYGSQYKAEQVLLQTALQELGTLDSALRKVVQGPRGFEAHFIGMTEDEAALACRRLQSHGTECMTIGPRS
ncbi:D-alanyl-D-alanine carboxypeptidase family protein [Rhodovulum euryhalinum]|uniref:D-alanyl-D-alanine carboxypeptidase n=1 Tax=Rhodovulum euryhalinum TaxID=35805 RepID=A0A4V2SAJ9_9RHOB|nr:D-alanyl-D-alanine carboxypeptidase family protein [Rhodovulum euryhalinum]TCO71980.1 D-alanyl-D-alanine carboxypeptidase [Rhodovulum euryhalinum]